MKKLNRLRASGIRPCAQRAEAVDIDWTKNSSRSPWKPLLNLLLRAHGRSVPDELASFLGPPLYDANALIYELITLPCD
jgi:hypothetical protein